jgi:hypothetical protein
MGGLGLLEGRRRGRLLEGLVGGEDGGLEGKKISILLVWERKDIVEGRVTLRLLYMVVLHAVNSIRMWRRKMVLMLSVITRK